MRKKILLVSCGLALFTGAAVFLRLRAGQGGPPASIAPAACVRLTFGWRDAMPRNWSGSVKVQGGSLLRIEGWRFGPKDSLAPQASWKLISAAGALPARAVWPGAACALEDETRMYWQRHPFPAVGVLLYLAGDPGALRLGVETAGGNFELPMAGLQAGHAAEFLDGSARAERLPVDLQPDTGSSEQDYPSLGAGPDGSLWLAYQSYDVARHADRILLSRYAGGRWSEPQEVAGAGDYYRPQAAVDGRGRVWVVWSALVNDDWELFGRYLAAGRWSPTERITSAPGGDFNQRLAAAADGRLWLAWQGNRSGNWDIFVSRLDGDRWSEPEALTAGPENDWEPSIAAGPDGRVAVAWDGSRRGSFNVYMRIFSEGRWQPKMAVASGEDFEAHAALAFDRQGRLWVAWDDGGPNWGLDSACNGLFHHRHIDLRAWVDGAWQMPLVKPMRDLPAWATQFVSLPHLALDGEGRLWLFFRHWTSRSAYEFYAMYLTAGGWSEPVWLPHSTGREYQSIETAAAPDGTLWAAWSTDGGEPRLLRDKHYFVRAAAIPLPAATAPAFPLQRGTPPLDITVTVPPEPARYTTTLAGQKLSVYWGDMHRHTDISSHGFTDGSLEDTYRYGSDVAHLDYLAPTDHVYLGTPTAEYIHGDDYNWWRTEKAVDLYYRAGVFVPVYAYERSMQSPGGHRNLLYLKRGGVPVTGNIQDPKDNDPTTLWERLAGQQVLVFPHTPADMMQPLIRWDYKNPPFEPLMEIYQGLRSSYEYRGAPEGRLGGTQTGEPGHFYQDALAKGLRYGVEASSDHLATHISFTGVYAEELSRPALFQAMLARHTFAASDKIIVDFRMGSHLMGDEFRAASPPEAEVKVLGTRPIRLVEVVRNNQVAYSVSPGKAKAQFRYRDAPPLATETYYYIRVLQQDGHMAWSSPIWIKPPGPWRQ